MRRLAGCTSGNHSPESQAAGRLPVSWVQPESIPPTRSMPISEIRRSIVHVSLSSVSPAMTIRMPGALAVWASDSGCGRSRPTGNQARGNHSSRNGGYREREWTGGRCCGRGRRGRGRRRIGGLLWVVPIRVRRRGLWLLGRGLLPGARGDDGDEQPGDDQARSNGTLHAILLGTTRCHCTGKQTPAHATRFVRANLDHGAAGLASPARQTTDDKC